MRATDYILVRQELLWLALELEFLRSAPRSGWLAHGGSLIESHIAPNGPGLEYQSREPQGFAPSSRERILQAAINEFDREGSERTSISQIAKAAGVTRSLVTYHFPTKSTIVREILRRSYPNGVFLGVPRAAEDPLVEIVRFIEHLAISVRDRPIARVALELGSEPTLTSFGQPGRYAGLLTRFVDLMEEASQRGRIVNSAVASTEARLLLGATIGLIDLARGSNSYESLVEDVTMSAEARIQRLSR